MGSLVLNICLVVVLPILLLTLFLQKNARLVMLAFICGVVVCFCAYFINTAVYNKYDIDPKQYAMTFAPIVEESLKFIPLLIMSIVFKKGRRGTTAMSFALGVGFCVVENFYYLLNDVEGSVLWIISRCIGTGLMHSMSSTLIGLGLFKAREEKAISYIMTIASLSIAIMYHGLYNLLVQSSKFQFIGVLIPMVTCLVIFLVNNKDKIKEMIIEDNKENDVH